MKKRLPLLLLLFSLLVSTAIAEDADRLELVESRRIWDKAPHNAFTDLIRFKDRWYCVFREGKGHVSPDGALRVITSLDGRQWESAALITSANSDLRDAKITVTPDGRLVSFCDYHASQFSNLARTQPSRNPRRNTLDSSMITSDNQKCQEIDERILEELRTCSRALVSSGRSHPVMSRSERPLEMPFQRNYRELFCRQIAAALCVGMSTAGTRPLRAEASNTIGKTRSVIILNRHGVAARSATAAGNSTNSRMSDASGPMPILPDGEAVRELT